jgi:hypothetical protein
MKGFKKNNFNRANSMPNVKKGQQRPSQTPSSYMHSNSDISKAFTEPAHFIPGSLQRQSVALSETHLAADHYTGILPTGGSAFPANTSNPVYPPPLPPQNPDDVVYEYVEHNSISLSSTLGKNQSPAKGSTSFNYYDKVASSSPSISSNQKIHTIEDNEYLRPKNTKSTTIPSYSEPSKERYLYERNIHEKTTNDKITTSFGSKHRRNPSEDFTRNPELLQNNTKSSLITPISSFPSKPKPPELPAKPRFLKSNPDTQSTSSKASSRESDKILLNTFNDTRLNNNGNNRSLTSLHSIIPEKPVSVFDRSETCTPTSPASSHDSYASTSTTSRPILPSSKLLHSVLRNEAANNLKETSLDWPKLPSSRNSRNGSVASDNSFSGSLLGRSYVPSEMDRSVGTSTIIAPNSPSQQFYDHDSVSERSMTPKAGSNSGETFV